jgi:uncharacterized membrane protein
VLLRGVRAPLNTKGKKTTTKNKKSKIKIKIKNKIKTARRISSQSSYVDSVVYLFIYSISFNVIQPRWLCRQIQTHKIADMSERRKKANKQKKTKQHR